MANFKPHIFTDLAQRDHVPSLFGTLSSDCLPPICLIQGKETAAMKADLPRARNMKRYINQLTVAKKQCEKRIRVLGGPAYDQQEDGAFDEGEGPQSQKVELGGFLLCHFVFVMHTDVITQAVPSLLGI